MRICEYTNNGVKCKNWIVGSDEEIKLCPVHAGVAAMRAPSPMSDYEKATKQRFETHLEQANKMSNEDLAKHILQLESLLEDVKLRQQAAAHVKSRRLKDLGENGTLTESQKAEIAKLRGSARTATKTINTEPKISKEEREIQKLMKLGMTREKAMKLMSLD